MGLRQFLYLMAVHPILCSTAFAESDWELSLVPYLYAPSIEGTAQTFDNAPAIDFSADFGDYVEDIEISALVLGTARKGRFGVSGDLQYIALEDDIEIGTSGSPVSAAVFESDTLIATLFADYTVYETPETVVTASLGLRAFDLDVSFSVSGEGGVLASQDNGESWVNPGLGARARHRLGGRWLVNGWMYGGGTDDNDHFSDLFAGLAYQFTDHSAGSFGYRYMDVSYRQDDFIYDVEYGGLMIGVVFSN